MDCEGKGTVRGLPSSCVCDCQVGYAGKRCQYCDVAYEGYPECRPRRQWSSKWRLMALNVPPLKVWHVADVTLHTDRTCTEDSMVALTSIAKRTGSYSGLLGPERAFDEEGAGTTWISSQCAGSDI